MLSLNFFLFFLFHSFLLRSSSPLSSTVFNGPGKERNHWPKDVLTPQLLLLLLFARWGGCCRVKHPVTFTGVCSADESVGCAATECSVFHHHVGPAIARPLFGCRCCCRCCEVVVAVAADVVVVKLLLLLPGCCCCCCQVIAIVVAVKLLLLLSSFCCVVAVKLVLLSCCCCQVVVTVVAVKLLLLLLLSCCCNCC